MIRLIPDILLLHNHPPKTLPCRDIEDLIQASNIFRERKKVAKIKSPFYAQNGLISIQDLNPFRNSAMAAFGTKMFPCILGLIPHHVLIVLNCALYFFAL